MGFTRTHAHARNDPPPLPSPHFTDFHGTNYIIFHLFDCYICFLGLNKMFSSLRTQTDALGMFLRGKKAWDLHAHTHSQNPPLSSPPLTISSNHFKTFTRSYYVLLSRLTVLYIVFSLLKTCSCLGSVSYEGRKGRHLHAHTHSQTPPIPLSFSPTTHTFMQLVQKIH